MHLRSKKLIKSTNSIFIQTRLHRANTLPSLSSSSKWLIHPHNQTTKFMIWNKNGEGIRCERGD